MSKLEDLINELCPDGVEWKSIQDTVGVNRGRRWEKWRKSKMVAITNTFQKVIYQFMEVEE